MTFFFDIINTISNNVLTVSTLHYFLCAGVVYCAFYMCISVNPIVSVLYLILVFCHAAVMLFVFHAEFLGLIFIIIYVGAIAVLFLFVIMMLNQKKIREDRVSFGKRLFILSFKIFLFLCVSYVGFFVLPEKMAYVNSYSDLIEKRNDFILLYDNLNNIDVMGQVLFNYYLVAFLLAGIILLIALVGSIVLTLRFNNSETSQMVSRQLARTDNTLSFFKNKR